MFTLFAIALTLTIAPENIQEVDANARPNFGMMGMPQSEDGLPPFDKVADGYDAVVSSVDGKGGMYTLYRDEDDHLLIELPAGFDGKPILIAYTVSSGIGYSGVQLGDVYGYWTRIHDQLVLVP